MLTLTLNEGTYAGSVVTRGIGLDPYNIFAPSKPPLGEDLSTPFQAVPCSAPYPKENEGGIGREGRHGQILQVRPREG